jgi:putative membrane protein
MSRQTTRLRRVQSAAVLQFLTLQGCYIEEVHMFKHVALLTGLALAFGAGLSARAQDPSSSTFLKDAAQGGLAEIELAQLAETKSSNPQVKSFAQMIVTDHTKANERVSTIASTKKIALPTDVSGGQRAEKAKLDNLSGAAFDTAYAAEMVRDHQQDIKVFEQAAKSNDPEVQTFASDTLPTLQHHLQEAQNLVKAVSK